MASADVRVGISAEVKNRLLPAIDHSHFLGYDDEDRIVLYTVAVALATKYKMAPRPGKFSSFVMMKSITHDELTQLLLMYLANQKDKPLDEMIDDIGVSRRKGTVKMLAQLANAGFKLIEEKMGDSEDMVVAEFFGEMDAAYQDLIKKYPELGLPTYHPYGA